MNCKYSIKYYDGDFNASEDSGIAFGKDEAEIVTNLKSYYGDFDELITSIKSKLFTLPDDTKVYPGHGPSTTISDEKKYNQYLR